MKTQFFETGIPVLLLLCIVFFVGNSCNLFEGNDDDGNTMSSTCAFEGFTYTEGNTQIDIQNADISTEYFPNASNGPFGAPGFEISSFVGTDTFVFVTNIITEGETGVGSLTISNGSVQAVAVRCNETGNQVGDQLVYDVTSTTIDTDICVTIDVIRN